MKRGAISNHILDTMIAKMNASDMGKALTCWVASATPCGKHTARIIVASSLPISQADAISVIHRDLNHSVIPYGPSFTLLQSEAHPNMMFASIHAYKASHKVRPADEQNMAKCQSITASTYLDVDMGTVWERREIDGKQYLLRANDDDLNEVMAIALTASVNNDARVEGEGFFLHPKKGDYVSFFAAEQTEDGNTRPFMDIALVTEVTANSVGILIEEQGHSASAYIPTPSVVNILSSAALENNVSRQDIINFLEECYGKEYAQALSRIRNSSLGVPAHS